MVAKQLTFNDWSDFSQTIDGNFISWLDRSSIDYALNTYDLATGSLLYTDVFASEDIISNIDISGSRIVFDLYHEPYGYDIYYRFTTELDPEERITFATNEQTNPSIWANLVVYEYQANFSKDIYLYDFFTNDSIGIATSTADQINPKISGSRIVYQEWDGNDWELWTAFTDGSNKTQLTFNSRNDVDPNISSSILKGSKIVYTDERFEDTKTGDIIVYDLLTNTTTSIVDSQTGRHPDIDGNIVVWEQPEGIWFGSTDGTTKTQLTFNGTNVYGSIFPKISGNQVVWQQYDGNDWEIFTQTILPDPIYRFYNPTTQKHFYTADLGEKDSLVNNSNSGYNFEGVGFKAIKDPSEYGYDPLLKPIYRFYNPTAQEHFYTADLGEKDSLVNNSNSGYNFEGVGFYAYGADDQQASDVYRFYNPISQYHFFTANVAEKDKIIAELGGVYQFEGVGFEAMI